jgi:3-keto-disaccharide hydrolase
MPLESPMHVKTLHFHLAAALLLFFTSAPGVLAQDAKWISLFDGESLEGWEKIGNEASVWEVTDGEIRGSGPASMLVCTKGPYKNFRYHAEVKINDGGNSGLYFRTTRKPGFSDGYEAQIDSTHTDPIRTGSLYGMCHVYQQHVKPDTWFTYDLEVRDDVWRGRPVTRIKITVDGNELYEFLDFSLAFKDGYFAYQQHDPGSHVSIRNVKVMPLTD